MDPQIVFHKQCISMVRCSSRFPDSSTNLLSLFDLKHLFRFGRSNILGNGNDWFFGGACSEILVTARGPFSILSNPFWAQIDFLSLFKLFSKCAIGYERKIENR